MNFTTGTWRRGLAVLIAASLVTMVAGVVSAQEFKLKLHNFNAPMATANRVFMKPWAEKIAKESGGRLQIQVFPSMQLGGKPADLYGQARDGVVDMVWSLQGYTAGQFPLTAVFDLPFEAGSSEAASQALMEFYEKHLKKEYKDVHVIVLHTTDYGILHTKSPVRKLEDLKGMKIRTASAVIGGAIKGLGAVPVGMPVNRLPEALTRGQVEGMMLPWSITRPFKLADLTKYHVEVPLFNSPFMLVMNKAKYNSLPADLKKVLDNNSGMALAKQLGIIWDKDATGSRALAKKKGNTITSLDDGEKARWKKASQVAVKAWIKKVNGMGLEGEAIYREAVGLVKKYQ